MTLLPILRRPLRLITLSIGSYLLAARAQASGNWGEPWGSFTWLGAISVPTTGVWVLGLMALALAFMGGSRFK